MIQIFEVNANTAAYRKLRAELETLYPPMHYVAFCDGKPWADSGDLEDLIGRLQRQGIGHERSMIVRIGDELPDDTELFVF